MVSLEEAKLKLLVLELQVEGIKTSYHDIRMVEMSVIRIGNDLEKMTGSREVKQVMNYLDRVIMKIRMVQIMLHALEIASGPIGWLYFGATALSTGMMIGEPIYDSLQGK